MMADETSDISFTDQHYKDADGGIHFLSAQDHENTKHPDWSGPTLPDPSWVPLTAEETEALLNPPVSLEQRKAQKLAILSGEYQTAKTTPISYTTKKGIEGVFKNDTSFLTLLTDALAQSETDKTWAPNVWIDHTNQPVSPFTYDDLVGLKDAYDAHPVPDPVTYMSLVSRVHNAKNSDELASISF